MLDAGNGNATIKGQIQSNHQAWACKCEIIERKTENDLSHNYPMETPCCECASMGKPASRRREDKKKIRLHGLGEITY